MSTTINQVYLVGRVGQDPTIREVNGTKVASFSLATSTGGYTNKEGKEVPEKTQWHNVIAWRNDAAYAEKVVKKGALVAVTGEISYRQFEKDGQKQNYTDIIVSSMVVFNANSPEKPAEQKQAPAQKPVAQPAPQAQNTDFGDVPF